MHNIQQIMLSFWKVFFFNSYQYYPQFMLQITCKWQSGLKFSNWLKVNSEFIKQPLEKTNITIKPNRAIKCGKKLLQFIVSESFISQIIIETQSNTFLFRLEGKKTGLLCGFHLIKQIKPVLNYLPFQKVYKILQFQFHNDLFFFKFRYPT